MYWPGTIAPRIESEPVATYDIFPTILKLVRKLRHDTAPFWTISTKKIQLYATPHVPCDMIYFVLVLIGF